MGYLRYSGFTSEIVNYVFQLQSVRTLNPSGTLHKSLYDLDAHDEANQKEKN